MIVVRYKDKTGKNKEVRSENSSVYSTLVNEVYSSDTIIVKSKTGN